MKRLLTCVAVSAVLYAPSGFAKESKSFVGRPLSSFDVAAFCSYSSFHPSQYLTDNNWDILCAFTEPGPKEKLDSMGIPAGKSQLRLLEVGGLLKEDNNVYSTVMPIFEREETAAIRTESKAFADSIFPTLRPLLKNLVRKLETKGFGPQTYSLVFSYLLDGYVWGDNMLPKAKDMEDHGTWSGVYWAMYDNRSRIMTGTNGYGPVKVNWTDSLGYYPGTSALVSFAREIKKTDGNKVDDRNLIDKLSGWGLVSEDGKVIIPVMRPHNNDSIDVLCNEIATRLTDSVKSYCPSWGNKHDIPTQEVAEVIFYHEVMWDLLDICEEEDIIRMPAILEGEKTGAQHFGDITFIVLQ